MRFRIPHIHWNHFRLHLVFFTIHPVIWSAIFYAANGQYHISYTDAFFLCFSAHTVTGLSTVNLSTLTGFQQAILFWLMIAGNYTTTSWVMVMVRRRYFVQKCAHVIRSRTQGPSSFGIAVQRFRSKTIDALSVASLWRSATNARSPGPDQVNGDSIVAEKAEYTSPPQGATDGVRTSVQPSPEPPLEPETSSSLEGNHEAEPSNTNTLVWPGFAELQRTQSPSSIGSYRPTGNPNGPVIELAEPSSSQGLPRTATGLTNRSTRSRFPHRTRTRATTILVPKSPTEPLHEQGFGGFAGPVTFTNQLVRRVAPGLYSSIERKLTLPASGVTVLKPIPEETSRKSTLKPNSKEAHRKQTSRGWTDDLAEDLEALNHKVVSYIKTGALWVGRNSFFDAENLSDEQLEEIGGVEYRAIKMLAWLIPAYFIGTQLCCFIIYTAYLESVHIYDSVFASQFRLVPKAWFSAFQAVSAYTGGGLSLVDAGMVPFVNSYTMVISLGMLIMAGNMLMPVFLRLIVWLIYHMLPKNSCSREHVQFLLDHPRRCYIYLFPSYQTWFLVAVFFFLTAIEWAGFEVFDIGLPVINDISRGPRVLAGLFQSLGVRASGFSIVSLGSLAPATKLLYILMMYISAYPIAMSIRSTNVYEERSLGVFEASAENETEEPQGEIFSKYLGWHVRRQLAYDLWWLAGAVLLICIIERGNIMNPDNATWFNQFTIIFEIVSAYATDGLSLGIPTQNYSLSGAFQPLSKIIICAVMLRGRHRDLPVAVDRAILLPHEFSEAQTAGRTHIIRENQDVTVFSPVDDRDHARAA
ncbi:TrkH-domain-containing protein [Neolentinus lepideus HHB14362 ss-1]|uniref:TrkH-domain-containing protein n=1 Tax=Neolentinus lepideus HHB14362 ss-1 TaxID=1314782 RepID=A0A165WB86_9AGAM|nr:TrkH-domain-containing protein [Neolentinus lepideus HHB14362 ss-1]